MPDLLFNRADHPDITFSDAFFLPVNGVEGQVRVSADTSESAKLGQLLDATDGALTDEEALTTGRAYFSYIMVLAKKYGLDTPSSRDDVDLTPRDGFGNSTPVVVANMNRVTGRRMAEAMARVGGTAAIPQDKSDAELERIAEYLQTRTNYPTAISVTPDVTVTRLKAILSKRPTDKAVAVDQDGKFLGIVSGKIIPEGEDGDRPIERYIRKDDVVTRHDGITPMEALRAMNSEHVEYLPILNADETVAGAYTQKEAAYAHKYKAHEGVDGGLAFLPTIGALNNNPMQRLKLAVELGAKGIVFDTANFDQSVLPFRNLEKAREYLEQEVDREVTLIAGNVVTRDAVRRVLSAGADIVKVGIGPGAMCSTRRQTGVGRPQFSAVIECAEEAKLYGKYIWADGGISYPRDAALALAYASQVMCGTMYAPTAESPTELHTDDNGRTYAINTGMAARQSSELRFANRSSAQLEESDQEIVRRILGHRAEGVESRVYQQPGMESAADVTHELMDGVSSAVAYAMSRNLPEFHRNARIGMQRETGFNEGMPK